MLDHLVDGGMAKICRARFLGEQADKIVAIKMIQPQFSSNQGFKKMFLDEIKVTFGLNHPNIAQTYDYGENEGQLYTALEYVDGANLKQFLDRLRKKKFVFPIEISIHIISQACQAMDFAHNHTDKLTNRKSKIIHRDISPHNIMLSYDGSVKIIDFGIAKAETNSEATQVGTIKGKLSYLAPEYLDGLTLDPRYDIFGLGITFWEMLCGRKLFTAENDLAILKKIQACKVPRPSTINPNVTPELDEIVLKALQKDRSKRYDSMDQFNRALVKYLYAQYPDFNPSDLSYFSKELFADEIKKDRARFIEYGKIDLGPYLEEMRGEGERPPSTEIKDLTGARHHDFQLDSGDSDFSTKDVQIDGYVERGGPSLGTRSTRSGRGTEVNPKADKFLKKIASKRGYGKAKRIMPKLLITAAALIVLAWSFWPKDGEQISRPADRGPAEEQSIGKKEIDKRPPLDQTSKAKPSSTEKKVGNLYLLNVDPFAKVQVNGKEVDGQGVGIRVPLFEKIELLVTRRGYLPYEDTFELTANNPSLEIELPDLVKGKSGLLSTSVKYTGKRLYIKINGKVRTKDLPVTNMRVPAGSYKGIIYDPKKDQKESVSIKIEENKRYFLD